MRKRIHIVVAAAIALTVPILPSAASAQSSSPPADLSIAGAGSPQSAKVGEDLTHTFTIRNESATTAEGVTFADVLPDGMEWVTSSCGALGERSVHCDLQQLPPGASTSVTIVLRAKRAGEFEHRSDVYSFGSEDPNQANNTTFVHASVTGEPPPPPRPCHTGFRGNDDANRIPGSSQSETIRGRGGNDWLLGYGGIDCLFGDSGNDRIEGGEGDDRLSGGAGNDRMWGDAGRDDMKGDSGNDVLTGGPDRDTFDGGAGNDLINAADGTRETVRCGKGDRDRVVAIRSAP